MVKLKAIKFTQVKTIYARLSRWALPLLVVILFFSLRECKSNRQTIANLSVNLDSIARQAKQFENKNGQLVAENKQIYATTGRQLEQLTDTIFNLKKADQKRVKTVEQYARIIQQFKAEGKLAHFVDEPTDTSTKTAGAVELPPCADSNYVRVPKPFMYMDSMVIFRGRVTRVGVWLDSIRIENTVHYRTIVNKTGFLNLGRTTTVQVLNSNSAIQTMGVTSITIPHRVNWWHRWGKPLAAAILAGAAVDHFKR